MTLKRFLVRVNVAPGFIGDAQSLDGGDNDADFFGMSCGRMFSMSSISKTTYAAFKLTVEGLA